jgi:phosphocarrier protein
MLRKKIQIINQRGLHARAATKLAQTTTLFSSEIKINWQGKTVNAKSIMGIMILAATQYAWIEVIICGEDEQAALKAIEILINQRFGEKP